MPIQTSAEIARNTIICIDHYATRQDTAGRLSQARAAFEVAKSMAHTAKQKAHAALTSIQFEQATAAMHIHSLLFQHAATQPALERLLSGIDLKTPAQRQKCYESADKQYAMRNRIRHQLSLIAAL